MSLKSICIHCDGLKRSVKVLHSLLMLSLPPSWALFCKLTDMQANIALSVQAIWIRRIVSRQQTPYAMWWSIG